MTQELYEKCQPWEQQFRWAIKSNFVHMSTGEFCKVAVLYNECFGEALTQRQINCNTCRLNALKRLGEAYFALQQEIAQEEKEKRLEEQENTNNPKKAGRKKKIDI